MHCQKIFLKSFSYFENLLTYMLNCVIMRKNMNVNRKVHYYVSVTIDTCRRSGDPFQRRH